MDKLCLLILLNWLTVFEYTRGYTHHREESFLSAFSCLFAFINSMAVYACSDGYFFSSSRCAYIQVVHVMKSATKSVRIKRKISAFQQFWHMALRLSQRQAQTNRQFKMWSRATKEEKNTPFYDIFLLPKTNYFCTQQRFQLTEHMFLCAARNKTDKMRKTARKKRTRWFRLIWYRCTRLVDFYSVCLWQFNVYHFVCSPSICSLCPVVIAELFFYIHYFSTFDISFSFFLFCSIAEEIFTTPEAIWSSDDGSHILFASFNDTQVSTLAYPWFASGAIMAVHSIGGGGSSFPETRTLRYPTPGSVNPEVQLYVVDVSNTSAFQQWPITSPITLDGQ